MRRPKRTRALLGALLATALGALALVALPGLAAGKDHGAEKRHHHGRHHHHSGGAAGTIASFDAQTGRLTIDLFGKDTVDGVVTDRTRIKCEDEHSPDISGRHRHDEDEPGDDDGDHGEDHHGDNSGPSGHDDNGTGANCTAADLVVGAVVQEAELEIEHGQATFEEVELAD
jgi:hypothetical protein